MIDPTLRGLTVLVLFAVSGTVAAHPGDSHASFAAAAFHPLSGADHLLAMLAIGLWSSLLGGAAIWKMPAMFVLALACGAFLGMHGIYLSPMEPLIALSVLLLGLCIAMAVQVRTPTGIAIVSLFALFHGHAHGTELPAAASGSLYLLGITVTSAALHLIGIGLGRALTQQPWLLRSGGAAIAGAGLWMVAGG